MLELRETRTITPQDLEQTRNQLLKVIVRFTRVSLILLQDDLHLAHLELRTLVLDRNETNNNKSE